MVIVNERKLKDDRLLISGLQEKDSNSYFEWGGEGKFLFLNSVI